MCLVSYIPLEGGFVLSSNRDEDPARNNVILTAELIAGKKVTFPADAKGGSWIFASDQGDVLCLLNGAFEIHRRRLPYRMSRGLVLKSYFEYDDSITFLEDFDFTDIEPFTLIIKTIDVFLEFRWDGFTKHLRTLNQSSSYIWSSSTLYDSQIQEERELYFRNRLGQSNELNSQKIRNIHLDRTGLPVEYAFVMNRMNLVKTISQTQIIMDGDSLILDYLDLLTDDHNRIFLN